MLSLGHVWPIWDIQLQSIQMIASQSPLSIFLVGCFKVSVSPSLSPIKAEAAVLKYNYLSRKGEPAIDPALP